jgi:malate dehydrogenase
VRSIAIIGAGELGSAVARQLAAADISARVVMVDDRADIAAGKALDIRQAAPIDGYATVVEGTDDESVVMTADAIVIADRAASADARRTEEWHGDQGVALVRRVVHLNERAILLCAGASHMELVERGVREAGIKPQRLVGSAPEALRSAVVSMTALEGGCVPEDVSLTVLGRPPGDIIVPWNEGAIAGRRAVDVLDPPAIARLEGRLVRLWPPGPLTLASAATRMLLAAATRSRHQLSAFVAVVSETGVHGRAGMLPVTMSSAGVGTVLTPSLSARDRVRLETALQR